MSHVGLILQLCDISRIWRCHRGEKAVLKRKIHFFVINLLANLLYLMVIKLRFIADAS